MNKLKLIVPVLIICIGVLFFSNSFGAASANTLMFSGNFEIDDVVLSFRIPGLISERLVAEGDNVDSGALIARLDHAEYQLAVDKASAVLEADNALLRELESGARSEEKQQSLAQLQM
ncbi:MAG: hypothetical protein ACD_39C00032G0002, partial [uncultured bacterium]